jgi:hypothetical protein
MGVEALEFIKKGRLSALFNFTSIVQYMSLNGHLVCDLIVIIRYELNEMTDYNLIYLVKINSFL